MLLEGDDLTVRDNIVYVRTVAGLKRVDVLLRRLDADYADPLELNPRSRLGVPGLMQAIRAGGVAMVNALGATLPGVLARGPVFGADLSPEEKARLIDAIGRRGQDYVGQEAVKLSTTPVWRGEGDDARLEPRPSILRLYVARTACTSPGTPRRERALSSSGSAKSASSLRTRTSARFNPDTVRMKTPSSRTVRSSPSTSRKPR